MLKYLHILLISILYAGTVAAADDKPASAESVQKLLEITDAQALINGVKGQLDHTMRETITAAQSGIEMTPEKQAILDHMRERLNGIVDEQLNWATLEPMYIKIYQASFTQQELDDVIAFYMTPAGRALVKKLPLVMQNLMIEMQSKIKTMVQQMRQIQSETQEQLKASPST